MARYIELDALVAEMERIDKSIGCDRFLSEYEKGYNQGKEEVCDTLLSFLDTLEVKDVDLEKEMESWRHHHFHGRRDKEASGEYLERVSQLNLAKYFFELGMLVSNKTKKGE